MNCFVEKDIPASQMVRANTMQEMLNKRHLGVQGKKAYFTKTMILYLQNYRRHVVIEVNTFTKKGVYVY